MPSATQVRPIGPSVLLLGLVSAMGSLGLDAILPVLPVLSRDLGIATANHVQMLVIVFALGLGLGNLAGGPLSDRFGRKPIIFGGCLLYMAGSVCAGLASSLGIALLGRIIQGMGGAFASVATTAMVRDEHQGPALAKIMSFAMVIFAMMPAIAPFLGKLVATIWGWRMIFAVFAICSALLALFSTTATARPTAERASLSPATLYDRAAKVFAFPDVRLAICAQTFNFGMSFATLSSIQPIFDRGFHLAHRFPEYFALLTFGIAISGFINGKIVAKIGIRTIVRSSFLILTIVSASAFAAIGYAGYGPDTDFIIFLGWAATLFFINGFTMGNLNALGMEPAGGLAGMASSLITSTPMIAGGLLAIPVGLAFDASPVPLLLAATLFSAGAAIMVRRAPERAVTV